MHTVARATVTALSLGFVIWEGGSTLVLLGRSNELMIPVGQDWPLESFWSLWVIVVISILIDGRSLSNQAGLEHLV